MDIGPGDFVTHFVPLHTYAAHLAMLEAGELFPQPRLRRNTPHPACDRTHDVRGRYRVDGFQEFVNPPQVGICRLRPT